jgi:hypothetical protein
VRERSQRLALCGDVSGQRLVPHVLQRHSSIRRGPLRQHPAAAQTGVEKCAQAKLSQKQVLATASAPGEWPYRRNAHATGLSPWLSGPTAEMPMPQA